MANTDFLATTVPLRTLLDRRELGAVLRAGSSDSLRRPVRWAHVSELTDPAPYLLGGELLLSCGVELVVDPESVERYVAGLVRAGVSALGFGLTPVFDAVPAPLVTACRRHDLPLLEIPGGTPFLAVCRIVGEEINNRTQAALHRLADAQRALTSAAAGRAPRSAVLHALGEAVGGWAVLTDAATAPEEVRELAERVRAGVDSAAAELADGTRVVLQSAGGSVLVVGKRARFDATDRGIIAIALALLNVLAAQLVGSSLAGLATALLTGRGVSEDVLGAVFGRAGGPYRVVTAADARLDALNTPLVDESGRIAIVDEDVDPAALHGLVAVSAPHPADGLDRAAQQARHLLERARSMGRSLHAEHTDTGFSAAVDPEAARAFAGNLLAPLDEHPQLVDTLEVWLAHHGNWDRTAGALTVHRNSVRHRIGRVRHLLGADLADPQVRMELWFALCWKPPA